MKDSKGREYTTFESEYGIIYNYIIHKSRDEYFDDMILHRVDGPAYIYYNKEFNRIEYSDWYYKGEIYTSKVHK